MNKPSFEKTQTNRKTARRQFAGPLCALLLAVSAAMPAAANAQNNAPADMPWMSGGVGDEALDAMRQSAAAYNVHITFSTRDGAYLALVPFTVTRGDGEMMYSGISDGPLLYLKLKPGSYRIDAELDGVRQTRNVRVEQGPVRLSFASRSTARNWQ